MDRPAESKKRLCGFPSWLEGLQNGAFFFFCIKKKRGYGASGARVALCCRFAQKVSIIIHAWFGMKRRGRPASL